MWLPYACWFKECCADTWIPGSSNGLSGNLADKVYGQHIAVGAVRSYINAHMLDNSPNKALSLAFHGGTGTGKINTSSIIAENKMPQGLMDRISPYMNNNDNIDDVDYRKAIFVFLSKDKTPELHLKTLDYKGLDRNSLELKDMEHLIKTNANSYGFSKSSLFSGHLITAHIPFLPLEKQHVQDCIRGQLRTKKYDATEENIKNIMQ
ncbi:TOR1 [Mytilus coruscus]|uniref:TOR1 n=1 Tax=Mytilus coruscus TaxID=42192 RepID=A0A6J8EV13_MYTCO|nr:TOR1 [Mytilus coruscus]